MRSTFIANKINLSVGSMVSTLVDLIQLGQLKLAEELVGSSNTEETSSGFYTHKNDLVPYIIETTDIINFMYSLALLK